MSYYQGDAMFRRPGVRMAGDPGFFSFLKTVGGAVLGAMPGVGGLFGKVVSKLPAPAARVVESGGAIIRRAGGAIVKHPVLSAAGAAGVAAAGGAAVEHMMAGGAAQKGFHISKKSGKLVRNRRMRVTNPRALRRAIRRATGFARLARRVLRFTSPKAPKGRAVFKHRRHKRV